MLTIPLRAAPCLLVASLSAAARAEPPERLADLAIPGPPELAAIARDVLDVRLALNPEVGAGAGLYGEAGRVPSYAPRAVAALDRRLRRDLAKLRELPWSALDPDAQIDARWVFALAEEAHHRLTVERSWVHRPGEWLEPLSNTWIAVAGQVPERLELQRALAAQVPAVLDEIRRESTAPTRRDLTTAQGLTDGLLVLAELSPPGPERDDAREALEAYRDELAARDGAGLPDYQVIGADSYAWRLKHAMLSPYTADALLDRAKATLEAIDARLEALGAEPGPASAADPTPEELAAAEQLDRAGLLALYDVVVADDLAALRAMDVLTVPVDLPPLRARETPAAMVPLTGDGGSMNPPTVFGPTSGGWWNVEHFDPAWTADERLRKVMFARRQHETQMGPYAAHEGVPGHHLQLSILRDNPDPVRTLFVDNAAVEGWGLYAEQLFWEHGGFGASPAAEVVMLRSYRFRARRVFYDVNVERGAWTLQQAADWRAGTEAGQAEVDPEVLRTIQWPTQLIGYFHGKVQLLELRDEVARARGDAFSLPAFHDEVLAAGPVPIALLRAKMLGLPIPAPPPRPRTRDR